jgi:L-fuconolactonase
MRIDAHQHFWRYDPVRYPWIDDSLAPLTRDFLPADLHPLLSRAGFDASVAVQTLHSVDETRWLLSLADLHPFIAGVVGWVDLAAANAQAQLESITDHPKLVGIRHVVQSERDDRFLLRPDFCRGVALLEPFGLAYDILIHPRHLEAAAEFVERFPNQRFVLDHLAKPIIRSAELESWARALRRLAAHPLVCAKLSGLVTEADWTSWTPAQLRPYLDVAFDAFGADRLMIGSDWPVCTVAAEYGPTMAVVTEYMSALPASDREAVFGGTARRFWNLPRSAEKE